MPEYLFTLELQIDDRKSPERLARHIERAIEAVIDIDIAGAELINRSVESVKVRPISQIRN
jgi:hypothetical protein